MSSSRKRDWGCLAVGAWFLLLQVVPWVAFVFVINWAKAYGAWVWVVAGGLAAIGWYAFVQVQKNLKVRAQARAERERSARPCSHGTVGAALKPIVCWQCTNEAEEREAQERVRAQARAAQAAAEAAIRAAEHQRKIEELKASLRAPTYLRQVDPRQFEKIVCVLFRKMGYEVAETPYVADGGIDGFLRRDGKVALLQCKRVQGSVGEPVLRDLWGNIQHHRASEGVVVTTGKVSRGARSWVQGKPIRIIELEELTALVREHLTEKAVVPEDFVSPAVPAAAPGRAEQPRGEPSARSH